MTGILYAFLPVKSRVQAFTMHFYAILCQASGAGAGAGAGAVFCMHFYRSKAEYGHLVCIFTLSYDGHFVCIFTSQKPSTGI